MSKGNSVSFVKPPDYNTLLNISRLILVVYTSREAAFLLAILSLKSKLEAATVQVVSVQRFTSRLRLK